MNKVNQGTTLATQILLALILGIAFGYFLPDYGVALKPIGDTFVRMIKMIVVPIIFSSLVMGIAGTGDYKKLGRIGVKSIVWFEVATTLALVIGLTVVNLLKPGVGVAIGTVNSEIAGSAAQKTIDMVQVLVNIVPVNIVDAMARGDMLQIVFFSVFFGLAAAAIGKAGEPVVTLAKSIAEIMFTFTWYVMKLAPIGIFALMAFTIGKYGLEMLIPLAKLIGSFYGALIIFTCFIFMGVLKLAGVRVVELAKILKEPILIAFSTTSSEAALPLAMEKLEKFGVPKHIVSFVLPTGYVFNLDGATLYSALAVVFIAQIYGIQLELSQQILIMATLMVSTKGLAAVPGAVVIVIAGTAAAFGLPMEGVALLLGIDRILDMGRTTVNLIGNCVAAVVVAVWEKEFPGQAPESEYIPNKISSQEG